MKPLIVLIVTFLVSCAVLKLMGKPIDYQLAGRIAMACMLLFTAVGHFAFTEGMAAMVPGFLPFKSQIVIVTGILEIVFAIGLLLPSHQHLTGWVVIIFFMAMLPANIKAAIQNINYQTGALDGPGLSYLWFRVPLQLLFIAWVYFSILDSILKK